MILKNMERRSEIRTSLFRGQEYETEFDFYYDTESGIGYTNNELDEINIKRVYQAYEDSVNIELVKELNINQTNTKRHPFTCCGGFDDSCKRENNQGILIATMLGKWVCPCGLYYQDIENFKTNSYEQITGL